MSGGNANLVFYADTYQPIQAGSIDGTDTVPHDNAVYRALLSSSAALYDPLGDPKLIGDPYCTVFVGRLSHFTTEHTLLKAMSMYGKVNNLRLVRHIVTGASRGYAFVEYETERQMRHAYRDAHHSYIDDSEIIVDYCRQQLMPGWIPRRLGGGLGGKKESGQLRFGGRERPFRAPLQPVPFDDLKKAGIPPPPQGRYMSRFEVPSPPRRKRSSIDGEESCYKRRSGNKEQSRHRSRSTEGTKSYKDRGISDYKSEHSRKSTSMERDDHHNKKKLDGKTHYDRLSRVDKEDTDEHLNKSSSRDWEEGSHKHERRSKKHRKRYSSLDTLD